MTGRKPAAMRVIFPFMESITASEKPTRKTTRNTSSSWLVTKLRTTSTSEVQRWMISPVLWRTCQA